MDAQAQEQRAQSGAGQAREYTWSWVRVGELVTIGVLVALINGLAASIGPGVLLLLQHVFGYIVVPTHLLETIAYVGLTIVVGLVILVALLVVAVRFWLPKLLPKDPLALTLMFVGSLAGLAAAEHLRQGTAAQAAQATEHAEPKADAPATAQSSAGGTL